MDNNNIVKKDKKGLFHIPYKTRIPAFNEFIKAPDKFTKSLTTDLANIWQWLVNTFTDEQTVSVAGEPIQKGTVTTMMASMFSGSGLAIWSMVRKFKKKEEKFKEMLVDLDEIKKEFPGVNKYLTDLKKKYKDDAQFAKAVKLQLENEKSPLNKAITDANKILSEKKNNSTSNETKSDDTTQAQDQD
jgi:hypothetical protein